MHRIHPHLAISVAVIGVAFSGRTVVADQPTTPTEGAPKTAAIFSIGSGTRDDALLQFAQKADINVIADAREYAVDAPGIPYDEDLRYRGYASRFSMKQGLECLQWSPKTALFWSAPDIVALARELADQGQETSWLGSDLHPGTPIGAFALTPLLSPYLKKNFGWDGMNTDFHHSIPIGSLPPNIRDAIVGQVQWVSSRWPAPRFDDDSWHGAKVGLARSTPIKQYDHTRGIVYSPSSYRVYVEGSGFGLGITIPDAQIDAAHALPAIGAPPVTPEENASAAARYQRDKQSMRDRPAAPEFAGHWDALPELGGGISFTAKRTPLGDLVAEMQKQSGVTLTTEQAIFALPVTIGVKEIPLGILMGTLARLEDADWQRKGPTSFVLVQNQHSELETKVLRLGDASAARDSRIDDTEKGRAELAAAILAGADLNELEGKEGVALLKLPEPLQRQIRDRIVAARVPHYLRALTDMLPANIDGYELEIGNPTGRPMVPADAAQMNRGLMFRIKKPDDIRLPMGGIIATDDNLPALHMLDVMAAARNN